jgi:very-short-patch-repair endonuclease
VLITLGFEESLKIFSVIYERIKDLTNICVYYGDPKIDKKEYFLYDKSEKRYYFYDFTILKDDLKIIIEYNGSKFHPRKYSLTEEEWKNWRCLFNEDIDADTKYKYDCKKRDLALDNGFQYLEIWSDDVFDSNIEKSIDFILQSLQNVV